MQINPKTKSLESNGRIVTVAVNMLGVLDYQDDISMPGSFTKTLKENFGNIRHYLNHDTDILIGCPIEGREENGALVFSSEIVETELGNDILALYKLYQKHGNTLQHSIGVEAVKRDPADIRKVSEWKLYEFSTLTKLGACPGTHLIDIKSMDFDTNPQKTVEMLNDALRSDFNDRTKADVERVLDIVSKSIDGKAEVGTCACGHVVDFNQCEIVQVGEAAKAAVIEYLTQGGERPEEVAELLKSGLSLPDMCEYTVCPECGGRIYRKSVRQAEPAQTTPAEKAVVDTFLVKLARSINNQ